ncbi:Crp/Fnr family transcriptional regulator [Calderihabitans maritimus]|uniref:cAMP-binding proteins n=1 Tax=Calderihabitans maritimus TaxID=1246530 RepID=A0A1Z5HUK7_9FIRM|nr:Crp/Fnr family transcriptional regulator [Calderihabitans maritimus]GAW93011.1 cAMP-binding proteins [Calderihabitans maritimus]
MNNIKHLRRIPIFADLSEDELRKLNEIIFLRRYRKKMFIFMEGEPGDGLYFVKSGQVKISKILEDGREKILRFLKEGDIFAEVLLFDPGPFPATAEAVEDSEIGIIRNEDMEEFLLKNPEIMLKILRVMSKRLRQAQMQVRDLAFKDTYGRLAGMLLKLAEEYGEKSEEGTTIKLSLSQQELANLIGSSRETVARILGDFRKRGAIVIKRQKITILDEEELQSWL